MQPLLIAAMLFAQAASGPALRIVVLEGEDAVNVTQQQTAVRPLIEVRDRNNLPVAGASVVFTIGGGQPAAFAGGLKTLTVTTSANGQAAGNGLSALRAGTVRIQVQASYLGQTATTTISQTNVATASAATQAGTASGGGGSGLNIAAIASSALRWPEARWPSPSAEAIRRMTTKPRSCLRSTRVRSAVRLSSHRQRHLRSLAPRR